jgi:outer membrane receptor protein involved in Fe transport
MKRLQFCLVLFCTLTLALGAFAQVQNGQFTGTVSDPSGAAIPNAKVTVSNPATNFSVTVTTNQSGDYTARELPVGVYKITAEAPGFKTFANNSVTLNAGTIQHVDFKMQMGQAREIVEVTGEAAAVNTEDSKLATTVGADQIANLALNGRNVYDLMQLAPGAVNVAGVDFENGHNTVVNGVRENFNGFLINGVNNKGLSGGAINTPIQDSVQEFQQLTLNNSAQYGSSAGAINNLVTKSGTNSLHGTAWYYGRNDALDANQFFLNQQGTKKPALRFHQFGGTLGGALIKDKLFFFGAFQDDRFKTSALPTTVTIEHPDFRGLVANTFSNSVANLLYSNFLPSVAGDPKDTIASYVANGSPSGFNSFGQYLCADNYAGSDTGAFGADPLGAGHVPGLFAQLFGYTPADDAGCPQTANSLGVPYTSQAFADARRATQMTASSVALFGSQTQTLGNLFNGREWSGRLDYSPSTSNRFSINYNWFRSTDSFGPCAPQCTRGFTNPQRNLYPNGQFSWTHTFSPTVLNEFRAGYLQNNQAIGTSLPGVPQVTFSDTSVGFGSYNGYPQFFKENVYQYSDMVSLSHGNHNFKIGADFRRNIENSEFNVARPSYLFFDPLFFAIDQPLEEVAGVNPDICSAPCDSFNPTPNGRLQSNVRHWRNMEFGAYFQDDWKVTKRLTLNLGLRYDLYQRHNELNNQATTFLKGPGTSVIDNITNGQGWLQQANLIAGVDEGCSTDSQVALAQLATVCGPGGFAAAKSLGKGDHNNFGPRLGFAWDVFGDGRTSLRGGFGVSYEGTLYNPLSNSRWNLPYYSFNDASNFLGGDTQTIIYGPSTGGPSACPNCGSTPTFLGAPQNVGQGAGAQAVGNLTGWQGSAWEQATASGAPNANLAFLTGIIFPEGVRDPYVYNFYLSVQRELPGKIVVQADYVGTAGHKLFRSEDINRKPGARLPADTCITDNLGRNLCSLRQLGGINNARLNPNYGRLRNWQNVVNSNYNSMQLQLKKQMTHGLLFNATYSWSHAIDNGSGWHNSATSANGAAAGDGFTTDQTLPGLDRGNAIFDIRNRFSVNYVWQIPGPKSGFLGVVAGGWQYSGIWSFQSGAHWEPFNNAPRALVSTNPDPDINSCATATFDPNFCVNQGGDYNLDRVTNDRPNSTLPSFSGFSHETWANGWGNTSQTGLPVFSAPCLACVGNIGRNTFVGPGQWFADMTLGKTFRLTERFALKFDAQAFNIFNHANFLLATTAGGAHNNINDGAFGQAAGTLNARNLQFGLRLNF